MRNRISKFILEKFFRHTDWIYPVNNRSQWFVLVNITRVSEGVSTRGFPLIQSVIMKFIKFREIEAFSFVCECGVHPPT